jgi:hypothetical protein
MPQSGNPRNVQIYNNIHQPPVLVAGFMQLGRTTVFELYTSLEICFRQPPPGQFRIIDGQGVVLSRTTPDVIVPIMNYSVISLCISMTYVNFLTSSG